jgi:hypothetical protein
MRMDEARATHHARQQTTERTAERRTTLGASACNNYLRTMCAHNTYKMMRHTEDHEWVRDSGRGRGRQFCHSGGWCERKVRNSRTWMRASQDISAWTISFLPLTIPAAEGSSYRELLTGVSVVGAGGGTSAGLPSSRLRLR